ADRAARDVADADARRSLPCRPDVGRRGLRRVGGVRPDRRPQRRGAGARRRPLYAAADDGPGRAGLLRVARRSETLRTVEHRVRSHAAAGPAGDQPEGSQYRDLGARAGGPADVVREHLKAFLAHLRLNENASAHTVRAYDGDLSQYLTFLAAHL